MSRFSRLIKEYCPNGVPYISLGDVYDFQYGTGNKIPTDGGEYPVYGSNGIVGTHSEYNSEDSPVIGHIGAYAGIVNWGKGKHFVTYNGVICKFKIKDKMIPEFGYQLLLQQDFRSKAKDGSQPFVSYEILKEPLVPVPPIEVQQEIVELLKQFENIENNLRINLMLEIKKRKKMYYHYLNKLINPDDSWINESMSDLCSVITKQTGFDYSSTIKPALLDHKGDNTYSFIQNKDFNGCIFNFDTDYYIPIDVAKKFPKITLDCPSILFSISGKIGNIGLYEFDKSAFIGGAIAICKLKKGLNNKYILYYLQSDHGQKYLFSSVKAASHLNITVDAIRKTIISFPSITHQNKIVKQLEKFEKTTTTLILELEKELEKRKKQYNYYREKLLCFKELMVNE